MVAQTPEEHFDRLFDLDEHWPLGWHRGRSEDDLFASCRVCDCGESHFAPAVTEGVESDPYFGEPFGFPEDKAGFVAERVEELAVNVPLARVFWDPEDFRLEFALLLFGVDSFDLTEFHDGFPWREVPEVVDTPLCDASVDTALAREGVGDVFWNAWLVPGFFFTGLDKKNTRCGWDSKNLPARFFFWGAV